MHTHLRRVQLNLDERKKYRYNKCHIFIFKLITYM